MSVQLQRPERDPVAGARLDVLEGTVATDAELAAALAAKADLVAGKVPAIQLPASTGGLAPTAVKTAAYTAAAGELVIADATAGNLVITLPAAAAGARVGVKRLNAGMNTVRLAPAGAATIDGDPAGATLTAPYTTVTVVSDGANWYVD